MANIEYELNMPNYPPITKNIDIRKYAIENNIISNFNEKLEHTFIKQ